MIQSLWRSGGDCDGEEALLVVVNRSDGFATVASVEQERS
jgi:hypothetical protein